MAEQSKASARVIFIVTRTSSQAEVNLERFSYIVTESDILVQDLVTDIQVFSLE